MKKALLFTIAIGATISLNAQTSKTGNVKLPKHAVPFNRTDFLKGDEIIGNQINSGFLKQNPLPPKINAAAVKIGETWYDSQSNSAMARRIILHNDGTISAIWTICPAPSPYTPRGTGYNYFNGTSWQYPDSTAHNVTDRLEALRTGFPGIGLLGTNKEVIINHNANDYLMIGTNPSKGSGTYTFFQANASIPLGTGPHGAIWPRIAVGGPGDSTLHVIANYSDTIAKVNGVKEPFVYSRSKDAGTTWDIVAVPLPGYDSTQALYGNPEAYSIDAVGNNVGILLGGLGKHLIIWKSSDNGDTFTRTLVDSFPYTPDYTVLTPPGNDSVNTNDGSGTMMLDPNGKAHVIFARSQVGRKTDGTPVFFPGSIGLIYWNEISKTQVDIPIPLSAVDRDGDGSYVIGDSIDEITQCRYGNNSVLHKPTIGMDASGNIYVVFSLPADNDIDVDNTGYQSFRDIWAVMSSDNGATWTIPVNLTSTVGVEEAYPSLAKRVDGFLHIVYQEDNEPGTALSNKDFDQVNNINYLKVDKAILAVGIEHLKDENKLFSAGQNFPNPFKGQTSIGVNMIKSSNVSVCVSNMFGQKVIEMNTEAMAPGYHNVILDASGLSAGVYFYTVKSGDYSITKKMIVE